MTTLWLDTETYSECDLKRHSTHRYAEHPSTEITVGQWAIDDGEPVVETVTAPGVAFVKPAHDRFDMTPANDQPQEDPS